MIDQRIYPLLQTLSAADLDWLAREIVDGLTAGHVATADPDRMNSARELARRQFQYVGSIETGQSVEAADKPFTPDEQLDYAATYTVVRLTDVIATMEASVVSLGRLLEANAPPPAGTAPGPIMLALGDLDICVTADMQDLRLAQAGLKELQVAITAWRSGSQIDGGVL